MPKIFEIVTQRICLCITFVINQANVTLKGGEACLEVSLFKMEIPFFKFVELLLIKRKQCRLCKIENEGPR